MPWPIRNMTKTKNGMANQKYDKNRQCHGLSEIRRKQTMPWLIINTTKTQNIIANHSKEREDGVIHTKIKISC